MDSDELYEHFRIEVDSGQEPLRIDKFLTEHMPHTTRNRIQQAADAVEQACQASTICVVGGQAAIDACGDLLSRVEPLQ